MLVGKYGSCKADLQHELAKQLVRHSIILVFEQPMTFCCFAKQQGKSLETAESGGRFTNSEMTYKGKNRLKAYPKLGEDAAVSDAPQEANHEQQPARPETGTPIHRS